MSGASELTVRTAVRGDCTVIANKARVDHTVYGIWVAVTLDQLVFGAGNNLVFGAGDNLKF